MRRAICALVSVAAFAVFSACAPPPPPPPPPPAGPTPAEMVAAANALDQRFMDAFSKGDVEGVMATYWNSPNVVSIGPDGMVTRGYDAIKAGLAGMFGAMPGAKLEPTTSSNDVSGDVVLGSGTWKLTIPAKPKPQVLEGRYPDVKAMRDGKWVYVMDHASVPLPPPPAGKKYGSAVWAAVRADRTSMLVGDSRR